MSKLVDELCVALGYTFTDRAWLEIALTHRSFGIPNNERLEFLGDAILNFVIADELYKRFPQASEGQLSRLRASLVKGETLAALAGTVNLGQCLKLGSGELKTGGYRRASILAGAFEALLGGIYRDGGFRACRRIITAIYKDRLAGLSPAQNLKDPKTRLQELLQARKSPVPAYKVAAVEGQAHTQVFHVECVLGDGDVTVGEGTSRRKAEQDAAQKALDRLTAK
ncbi:MAG TPA: ribonuclease III [Gammaproteobacteria bacterium]|nr:ribonuclease III [Gammaproteobacteria bacterium]